MADTTAATSTAHRLLLTNAADIGARSHPILIRLMHNLRVLVKSENPRKVERLYQVTQLAIFRIVSCCTRSSRHLQRRVVSGLKQTSNILLLPRLRHILLCIELTPQLTIDVISQQLHLLVAGAK